MLQHTSWAFQKTDESEIVLNCPFSVDAVLQKKEKGTSACAQFLEESKIIDLVGQEKHSP